MRLTSAIAIYFVIWWTVLFAVLPWGVRNAHEAGEEVETGNEPGAPVNPQLLGKALVTTVIATIAFALVYAAIVQDWIAIFGPPS